MDNLMLRASLDATIGAFSEEHNNENRFQRTTTLSHRKRRPNLAVKQRSQPLLLLRRGTVACKDLCVNAAPVSRESRLLATRPTRTHVACIWRRAVESLRRRLHASSENLRDERILHSTREFCETALLTRKIGVTF